MTQATNFHPAANTGSGQALDIGVMTFWESHENYGQLLQAYALQAHLRKKGHRPFIIKYHKALSVKKHKPGLLKRLATVEWQKTLDIDAVRKKLSALYMKPPVRDRGFEQFKRHHLAFSPDFYTSINQLRERPPKADLYISGSDQVWNYRYIGDCEPFFLQFGEKATKRISYAASFGQRELPLPVRNKYKNCIKGFQRVSVREQSGVALCKELGIENAQMQPDPTLLLSRDEWAGMSHDIRAFRANRGKRIFIYTLGNRQSAAKDPLIRYVRGLYGANVAHVSVHGDDSGNVFPTIPEWLGYLKDCDLVITNSFHGMLFSTIFNKNFIGLPSSGDKAGMNERLKTLGSEFKLGEHFLYNFDVSTVNRMMRREVDWQFVNQKIDQWKKNADFYLNFG